MARQPAPIGVPTPTCSAASSCRNSKTARSLFRVGVLCSAASSRRYRWLNPVGLADWVGLPNPHSCRYCGTKPGFDFLLESLSWFKPG